MSGAPSVLLLRSELGCPACPPPPVADPRADEDEAEHGRLGSSYRLLSVPVLDPLFERSRESRSRVSFTVICLRLCSHHSRLLVTSSRRCSMCAWFLMRSHFSRIRFQCSSYVNPWCCTRLLWSAPSWKARTLRVVT